jgi:hypothetical protein
MHSLARPRPMWTSVSDMGLSALKLADRWGRNNAVHALLRHGASSEGIVLGTVNEEAAEAEYRDMEYAIKKMFPGISSGEDIPGNDEESQIESLGMPLLARGIQMTNKLQQHPTISVAPSFVAFPVTIPIFLWSEDGEQLVVMEIIFVHVIYTPVTPVSERRQRMHRVARAAINVLQC